MLTRKAANAEVLKLQAQLGATVGYETRKNLRERVKRLAKEVEDLKKLNESLQWHLNEANTRAEEARLVALQARNDLEEVISGTRPEAV